MPLKSASYLRGVLNALAFCAVGWALGSPALAATNWINGQAATLVLGADNLTSTGGGAASATRFTRPSDICTDASTGKVFVMAYDQHRILRFSSAQATTNGGAAEAVFGQPDFTSSTPNNGGRSASSLFAPMTCAIDADGRLFVTDYVNKRVLRFDNAASKASSAPADGVLGQDDFTSIATGTTASRFGNSDLFGIALSSGGSLYVSDGANNRVLRFDNAASKANGAAADGVLGAPNFTTQGAGGVTASTFDQLLWGLTVDSSGNLYVSDAGNERILRFDNAAAKANGAAADGVLGAVNLTTAGAGGVTASTFSSIVHAIEVLPDGALYVVDFGNSRVLVFNSPAQKANGAAADYVLGQPDFISNSSAVTAASLNGPLGLGYNGKAGYLMIADYTNNRVVGHYQSTLVASSGAVSDPGLPSTGSSTDVFGGQTLVVQASGSGGTTLLLGADIAANNPVIISLPGGNSVQVSGSAGAVLRVVYLQGQYALALDSGSVTLTGSSTSPLLVLLGNPPQALYAGQCGTQRASAVVRLGSDGALVSVVQCYVTLPAVASSALARAATAEPRLYAGEQARWDAQGRLVAGSVILGSSTGGLAGDPSTLPRVSGLTVQARVPLLNASPARTGENLLDVLRTQAQGVGLQLAGPDSFGGLLLTDAGGARYSVGVLGPVEVDAYGSRTAGAGTSEHAIAALTQGQLTMHLSATLADLPGLAAHVLGQGGSTTLLSDGGLLLQWPGQRWAVQPAPVIESSAAGAALTTDAQGRITWTDSQGRLQQLHPTVVDFAWVKLLLQQADTSTPVRRQSNGSISVQLGGLSFTLTPDHVVQGTTVDRLFDTWWIGADGRLYVRYPGRGMTQAFNVR